MSEENVELVRSITTDWGQGNYSSAPWAHPDIELVGADGVTRGINEVGKRWAEFLEAWDDFATVAEEILEAGDDRVLALVRFQGRGRGSGTPVADFYGAQLFTLRDKKVVRLELFSQRDDALEAAGLSEQTMSQENVEIVKQLFKAFGEGMKDGDPGAWFDSDEVDDDLEWIGIPGVGLGTYRGRDEFVEFMRVWTADFENWAIDMEQVIDAGNDRVVTVFRQTATGVGSGVPVELVQGAVNELEAGRLIRVRHYASPAEALEAAGLSE